MTLKLAPLKPAAPHPVTDEQIDAFIAKVNTIVHNPDDAEFWTLEVARDNKMVPMRYLRISRFRTLKADGHVRNDGVYCFIDVTNGDILKGAYKAPVKNGVRANLFDANYADALDEHGPKYLPGYLREKYV